MIYTAITRTKLMCWCVGNMESMTMAANYYPPLRHENLGALIARGISKITDSQALAAPGAVTPVAVTPAGDILAPICAPATISV